MKIDYHMHFEYGSYDEEWVLWSIVRVFCCNFQRVLPAATGCQGIRKPSVIRDRQRGSRGRSELCILVHTARRIFNSDWCGGNSVFLLHDVYLQIVVIYSI